MNKAEELKTPIPIKSNYISGDDMDKFIIYLEDKHRIKIDMSGLMHDGHGGCTHYLCEENRHFPSILAWLNIEQNKIIYQRVDAFCHGFDLNKEWVIDPEMSTYKKEALLVNQGLQKALEREYEKLGLTEDEKDKRCQYLNMIMTPDADVLALATSDSPLELAEAIKQKYKKAHKELYEINRNEDGSHD